MDPKMNKSIDTIHQNGLNIQTAIALIPIFNGEPLKLPSFITACDLVSAELNSRDAKMLLTIIKLRLDPIILAKIQFMKFEQWEDLKYYLTKECAASLSTKLINLKQRYNESLKNFGDRIEELLHLIYYCNIILVGQDAASITQLTHTKIGIKIFENSLREPLKTSIKCCKFSGIRDAINFSVEKKAIQNSAKCTNKLNFNNIRKHPNNNIICYICKKRGHIAPQCFLNRTNNNSTNKNN